VSDEKRGKKRTLTGKRRGVDFGRRRRVEGKINSCNTKRGGTKILKDVQQRRGKVEGKNTGGEELKGRGGDLEKRRGKTNANAKLL